MKFSLTRIEDPAAEPVLLQDVIDQLKISEDEDQTFVQSKIRTAREAVENWLGVSLITQKWRIVLDTAPTRRHLILPRPPVTALTAAKYYTDDDTEVDWGLTHTITDTEGGRIFLKSTEDWPTNLRAYRAMLFEYTTGYGATYASVPTPIREAILLQVGRAWMKREAEPGGTSDLDAEVKSLIMPYSENLP